MNIYLTTVTSVSLMTVVSLYSQHVLFKWSPSFSVYGNPSADAVDVGFDQLSLPPHLYLLCMFWMHMKRYSLSWTDEQIASYIWIRYDNKAVIWSLLLSVGLFSVWPFIFNVHLIMYVLIHPFMKETCYCVMDSYCVMHIYFNIYL